MATSNISDAEWQKHEPTIRRLYLDNNWTLEMVIREMSSAHGFSATKSQYTTRFKAWNLKKNSNSEFWKGVNAALKRRHLDVANANVYYNDDCVPQKRLKKELPRYTAKGGQTVNDAAVPATPEGVTIYPLIGQAQSAQLSVPRGLIVALPWHKFVDTWTSTHSLPTLTARSPPAASPIQIASYDWASYLPPTCDSEWVSYFLPACEIDLSYGLRSPITWDQSEASVLADIDLSNLSSHTPKSGGLTRLRSNVTKFFGVSSSRVDKEDVKTLEKHLRPFLIERQPKETHRAVQDLMDPESAASMQILMSYMALLLSNDLVMDGAIQAFLAEAEELNLLGNLKPLFSSSLPTSKAVLTRILHAAIHIDATKFLSQALYSGADLESPSTGVPSLTLLQKALQFGKKEAAQILIDAGADVNAGLLVHGSYSHLTTHMEDHVKGFTCGCNIIGPNSPLALAAQSKACVNLIPDLIRKGAKVPKQNPVLLDAISQRASAETVSCLIEKGVNVNECATISWSLSGSRSLSTPLSIAAKAINLELVKLLLDAGADSNGLLKPEFSKLFRKHGLLDDSSPSPLLCVLTSASIHDDNVYDIARLLLEHGGDPNASTLDICLEQDKSLNADTISELYNHFSKEDGPLLVYPLQAAAKLDKVEILELLIRHNATVNTKYGTPALAVAAERTRIGSVRFLLSQNADPNGVGKQAYCRSPLEAAVETQNVELIDLLLASGADINKCSASEGGHTPLQRAAQIGNEQIIEYLLQHGASMLSPSAPIRGASLLAGLIYNRLHNYVSQALMVGANPNRASEEGNSPLAAAVVNNDTASLQLLLAAGANIHEYSSAELPDYADVDIVDENREFFLSMVLSPIQWAAALNYVDAARMLCEAGANVNQPPRDSDGNMALHLAVSRGNLAMARFLITRKAQVDSYSNKVTPLVAAIKTNDVSMLNFLLRNGADPNQPPFEEYCSPLEKACSRGHVSAVKILLRAGAATSERNALACCFWTFNVASKCKQEIVEFLLKYGADVNQRHYDDHTCLQTAIMEEEFDCAYQMIEAGACINAPPLRIYGVTALQAAVSVGDVDMVEHLLSHGAEVNAPAAIVNGVTALQAAAIKGYLRIAQILLEHGADIDAKAGIENGRTAIEGAAEFGRMDMVKFLLDNYQGPRSISDIRDIAFKAAEKGKQWYVMEMLKEL